MALFASMGVLTNAECMARQSVMLSHYIGTVEMEVRMNENPFSFLQFAVMEV